MRDWARAATAVSLCASCTAAHKNSLMGRQIARSVITEGCLLLFLLGEGAKLMGMARGGVSEAEVAEDLFDGERGRY